MSEKDQFQLAGSVKLTISSETLAERAQVEQQIENLAQARGWINCQSKVIRVDGQNPIPKGWSDCGAVLAAELTCGDNSCRIAHVAHPSGGRWHLLTLSEGAGDESQYDDMLYVTVNGPHMRYRRYWCDTGDGLRPFAYRFVGFEAKT